MQLNILHLHLNILIRKILFMKWMRDTKSLNCLYLVSPLLKPYISLMDSNSLCNWKIWTWKIKLSYCVYVLWKEPYGTKVHITFTSISVVNDKSDMIKTLNGGPIKWVMLAFKALINSMIIINPTVCYIWVIVSVLAGYSYHVYGAAGNIRYITRQKCNHSLR